MHFHLTFSIEADSGGLGCERWPLAQRSDLNPRASWCRLLADASILHNGRGEDRFRPLTSPIEFASSKAHVFQGLCCPGGIRSSSSF